MDEREFLNLVAKESSFLIAAHEMKTPLSIIRQLSLTLNDEEIELSNSEKSRILRQIDITSERALRLVQDLTRISKLEDAMFELEPINSKKICNDVVAEIADVFKLHGRVIRFKNVRKNELIMANYELLHSILMNFSDNALYSSNEKSEVEIKIFFTINSTDQNGLNQHKKCFHHDGGSRRFLLPLTPQNFEQ